MSILHWIEQPAVYTNVDSLAILLPDNESGTLNKIMLTLHEALTARFTDATEIQDVANHGCQGGVNSFIWNHEVAEFFDQYEEEIYDYLNDCELSMKDFVKDSGATITTLKVDMVWCVVELWRQAQNMVNEMEAIALAA